MADAPCIIGPPVVEALRAALEQARADAADPKRNPENLRGLDADNLARLIKGIEDGRTMGIRLGMRWLESKALTLIEMLPEVWPEVFDDDVPAETQHFLHNARLALEWVGEENERRGKERDALKAENADLRDALKEMIGSAEAAGPGLSDVPCFCAAVQAECSRCRLVRLGLWSHVETCRAAMEEIDG